MSRIVVIGGGGHAKVIISVSKKSAGFDVLGYTDLHDGGPVLGVPYLGTDDRLPELRAGSPSLMVILGMGAVSRDGLEKRKAIQEKITAAGFEFATVISPDAIVNEDVQIGPGTFIADGVVINTGTRIGAGVIINTRSTIDHDCVIGDQVHIAPGVAMSGGVEIGQLSMLGTGSSVIQSVRIGERCMLGAGSVATKNIREGCLYFGVPAKKIK